MIKLNGIFPPLPTSFDTNEDLALDKMTENIHNLNQYNLTGFLILGSNGELINLTEDEKHQVYEATREAISKDEVELLKFAFRWLRSILFKGQGASSPE